MLRALEKMPEECTREDKAAVEFFYKKALVCVEANITTKDIWVANNTCLSENCYAGLVFCLCQRFDLA